MAGTCNNYAIWRWNWTSLNAVKISTNTNNTRAFTITCIDLLRTLILWASNHVPFIKVDVVGCTEIRIPSCICQSCKSGQISFGAVNSRGCRIVESNWGRRWRIDSCSMWIWEVLIKLVVALPHDMTKLSAELVLGTISIWSGAATSESSTSAPSATITSAISNLHPIVLILNTTLCQICLHGSELNFSKSFN